MLLLLRQRILSWIYSAVIMKSISVVRGTHMDFTVHKVICKIKCMHQGQRSAFIYINYTHRFFNDGCFAYVPDDPMVCSISNPDFVIYSSVVSFYLPFIVTLLVYIRIYVFLRMRRKRIAFGQASGKIQPGSIPPSVVKKK